MSGSEFERVSVQTTRPGFDPIAGYAALSTLLVRCDRQATFFVVSNDATDETARRGFTWVENDAARVTVYAAARDNGFYANLAEAVVLS